VEVGDEVTVVVGVWDVDGLQPIRMADNTIKNTKWILLAFIITGYQGAKIILLPVY
jgi:hypothetical protein